MGRRESTIHFKNAVIVKKTKILLGTISIIHSNWIPYAVGCIISHCNKIQDITDKYEFLPPIYKHAPVEEYKDVLLQTNILGLTCYVWNQQYNDELSVYFKSINPNGVIVYGGPQVPENSDQKKEFDLTRPWLHTSIAGLGEIAFSEWLLDLPFSNKKLTDIPTPYTDGIFEELLSSGEDFKVSFETNRGCPYSCSFCDWGGQSRSKLTTFGIDKVYQTIDYLYTKKNVSELEILDANFGILARDIDIIDYMILQQNLNNNNLKISYSGLAKNGSKNLPIILEKIFNNVPIDQRNLKISFQTHTPEVLKIVNRSNIDNNRLLPLIQQYKANNIPITSEMIIALPGETAESWLKTLHHNYHNLGIDYVRSYFLHLVTNIEMTTPFYKKKYDIKTKIVKIGHQEFEIIHRCFSYDLEQLVLMFDYHWFYHNLINTNLLKPYVSNLYEDCVRFFNVLDNFPQLRSIVESNRQFIRHIFSDEEITTLDDKLSQRFFSSSMRRDDIKVMLNNQNAVSSELSLFLNKPLEIRWECDDVFGAMATIK